ncbi:MAG: response regulator transcription factor [Cyclobacteriaceae bacterium]|nr:response regulator transcription factor [Cyclobacteriaceae bacterium]
MDNKKILIVEDDPNLGQILSEYLQVKGYDTTLCRDGEEGLAAYHAAKVDLCILDIMMPKKDGFTLAREIRDFDKKTPIIFLTAKALKEDTIKGLKIGADDFMTKPFSMEELQLRMQAVLRRVGDAATEEDDAMLKVGKFDFDTNNQLLEADGQITRLTTKESALLKVLVQHKNKTLQRSDALKNVWGDDSYFNARSMDVYIAKLRKILKDDESVKILSVHGEGFKLLIP